MTTSTYVTCEECGKRERRCDMTTCQCCEIMYCLECVEAEGEIVEEIKERPCFQGDTIQRWIERNVDFANNWLCSECYEVELQILLEKMLEE